jgi:hypothetical protein
MLIGVLQRAVQTISCKIILVLYSTVLFGIYPKYQAVCHSFPVDYGLSAVYGKFGALSYHLITVNNLTATD